MFFCKYIFWDVPKALSVKEIKAIPDNSNFLEMGIFLYLRLVLFLWPPALRLPPYEYFPLVGSGSSGLGMRKVCSDDWVRWALGTLDEATSTQWLQTHLLRCYEPLLTEPWILDVDMTVKSLYGNQEGAEVGYNPHKPGRPSHTYHTYFIGKLSVSVASASGSRTGGNGTSSFEQMKCAKEINNAVGRPVVIGAEAIKYLDIPLAEMRPNDSVDRSVASFREIAIREPVQTLTSS